jgi:hypothetical protein
LGESYGFYRGAGKPAPLFILVRDSIDSQNFELATGYEIPPLC